jgi:EmrB/QacA subfamily drug resistance transporter
MEDKKTLTTVLVITTISSFLTPFMGSSINIALPSIGKFFHADVILLNWVATAFLLSSSIFLLPMGKLADTTSRKKVFLTGIIFFTLSTMFCALSGNISMLIMFRVFQGIGGAMIFSTAVAILTSSYPLNKRGKVLGINVAATYIGLSLGPTIGGILVKNLGWQSVFWFIVPVGFLVIFLALLFLKDEKTASFETKFDYTGTILYAAFLASLMYGFSILPQTKGFALIAISLILVTVFTFYEQKTTFPLLNINLLKVNKVFRYSNLAAFINYASTFAVTFLLSFYLQYIKQLNAQQAGFILLFQPILMAILSPFTGNLSDKIEPRIVATIGMSLSTIGLIMLAFISFDTSIMYIIFSLVILGTGFALFSSPNTNAVMSSVEKQHFGIASATLGTMRLTGQMFSMGMAMLIFSVFIGKNLIDSKHFVGLIYSLNFSFALFSLFSFAGIFASFIRGNVRN